jgi:hypothetical protein
MIRYLKVSGLVLCAVFAFGALSASTASAANDLLTSGSLSGATFLTGEQIGGIKATPPNVWGVKSAPGTIECEKAKYVGSYGGTTTGSIEVTPTYEKCKSGAALATVTDNGCKFVLTGTTDAYTNTAGKAESEDATFSLNCEDKNSITVSLPGGCVITFADTHPAGTPVNQKLLGVKDDNEVESAGNKKWDVKVTVTVDNIFYTSNANCEALGTTTTDKDGFLTTTITLKAYEDASHTKQVNLTWS